MITEDQLEQLCLEWFRAAGWEVLHGPDIAPDGPTPMRGNYQDVLLKPDLEKAFTQLNPHLPSGCFEQVWATLTKPESLDLITNNRHFHKLLLDGVPVDYKGDDEQWGQRPCLSGRF